MKFIIPTQELNYMISKCLNVIPGKPAMPVLANILIIAQKGFVSLSSTDLTVSIRCTSEVEVIEEGSTTVPAKKISSLCKELTSANVEFSTNDNQITTIISGSSRFRINGMSENEFPAMPKLDTTTFFQLPQQVLKDLLYRTAFAVSRDDNRFVLTGVLLQIANKQATFIGTDGKRLARLHQPLNIDLDYTGSFVIPLKAIDEIINNLTKEGMVTLRLTADKIAIQTENMIIITKLLVGEYPDINRVIPASVEHLVPLHREELISLLRQVSLFTHVDRNVVRFAFSNGELELSANTTTVGEGNVNMPVNYQGNPVEIAFNPTYFLDVLRHSTEETVTIGITDAFTPGIISDKALTRFIPAETTPLFVLMPMRLHED